MSRNPPAANAARSSDFLRDTRGAAAAELVLWITLMLAPVMSVMDVGFYAFQRMQVELAAQAGVQAIRLQCNDSVAPLTKNCATFSSAVTTAVHGTLLADAISVKSGYPSEGYYCVNGSALVLVGTSGTAGSPPTKPSPYTCDSVTGGSTAAPGTYVRVSVQHTYTPVFSGISVASLLPSPITATAWLRTE